MKEIDLYPTQETAYRPYHFKTKETPEEGGESFGTMLKSAIGKVTELQTEADKAIQDLAAGKNKNIHRTMIALEKADVSFQLMMQIRNKLVQAYQEVKDIRI